MVCYHGNTDKHCAVKVMNECCIFPFIKRKTFYQVIPQSDNEDIRKRVLREIEIVYIGRVHK